MNILEWIGSHFEYKSEVIIILKNTEIVHTISIYIRMDRDWINSPCINVEYEKRVEEFIQFVQRNEGISDDDVKFICPCVNYLNTRKLNVTEIREHLICNGFLQSYKI